MKYLTFGWFASSLSLSLSIYIYIYKDTYMIAWYKHETPQYQISSWLYNIHPCSHSKYATNSLSKSIESFEYK